MGENDSDLTKWRSTIRGSCSLMSGVIFNVFKGWDLMCQLKMKNCNGRYRIFLPITV